MRFNWTWLLLLPIFLAISCSDNPISSVNVNQEFIRTEYEWRYDENEETTTAYAFFYEIDTGNSRRQPLLLTGTSKVYCNGQELVESGAMEGLYEWTFQGRVDTGYFDWVDTDGWWYYNDAVLDPIYHPEELHPFQDDAAFNYTWNGLDIFENQEVSVNVRKVGGENNGDSFDVSSKQLGDDHIRLPKKRLKKLGVGTVIVRLEREWTPELQQSTFWGGGEMRVIYIPTDAYTQIE